MDKAVILFGHGSRDPAWRQPIESVAARVAMRQPGLGVACAYLELEQPDLATAAAQLVDAGAKAITILPMFLGTGKHARHDLPVLVQALREQYPGVIVKLELAVGENPHLLDVLADLAVLASL